MQRKSIHVQHTDRLTDKMIPAPLPIVGSVGIITDTPLFTGESTTREVQYFRFCRFGDPYILSYFYTFISVVKHNLGSSRLMTELLISIVWLCISNSKYDLPILQLLSAVSYIVYPSKWKQTSCCRAQPRSFFNV